MRTRDDAALGETSVSGADVGLDRTRASGGAMGSGGSSGATQTDGPPPAQLEVGGMFRRLEIRGLLGEGAMGQAYLASHVSLRVPVVIKLFRNSTKDPLAEAHLAARVASPWVVPVLDAGVEHGLPYVIQRYVDGIDFSELLAIHDAAQRAIPVAALVRFAVQLFYGLAAVHVAGVVHRDIKPPNLFLAGTGDALVGDLGIAVDPTGDHRAEVAGTPMFIAPELWNGERATARTDLYSAGATLHLLWQRLPPFQGNTAMELARMHCDQPYEPVRSSDPVGAYFAAVLARLLSKAPSDRPESALGTARMLERIATPPPEVRGQRPGAAQIGDITVELEQRDITSAVTDVIVCAANEDAEMSTGVAAAVRRAGGESIYEELHARGIQTMGSVVWTTAGNLACKDIAHAVAAAKGAICIQRAVLRVLFEAERRQHISITFPALGTGVGGVPHGLGARLMLESIRTFAAFAPRHVRTIRIALPTAETLATWTAGMVAMDATRSTAT
ncbi:MAG TPA: serine/threonine-protein kinase [Kofleriaceae bacterium]